MIHYFCFLHHLCQTLHSLNCIQAKELCPSACSASMPLALVPLACNMALLAANTQKPAAIQCQYSNSSMTIHILVVGHCVFSTQCLFVWVVVGSKSDLCHLVGKAPRRGALSCSVPYPIIHFFIHTFIL